MTWKVATVAALVIAGIGRVIWWMFEWQSREYVWPESWHRTPRKWCVLIVDPTIQFAWKSRPYHTREGADAFRDHMERNKAKPSEVITVTTVDAPMPHFPKPAASSGSKGSKLWN